MPSQRAVIWAGATGAAVVVVGAATLYAAHPSFLWPIPAPAVVVDRAPSPAATSTQSKPAEVLAARGPAAAASAAVAVVKPAFDVVTVQPTGEAVVAGRAAPNVTVELRDAGKTLAEAKTDAEGAFVMIPPALPPGGHSLSLATGAGPAEATSEAIQVLVPEPAPKTAIAAAPSQPAATPPTPAVAIPSPPGPARVAIESVEASAGGRLVAKGAAEPNATVRLYLSGAFVGDAKTKQDGRWSLTIEHGLTAGAYAVRADEIDPANASVVARAEAPFDFPASAAAPGARASAPAVAEADSSIPGPAATPSPADVVVDSVRTAHVEQGNTLWGLSQTFYGDGSRYQIIFAANANQIRDPHWIYPGQILVVPKAEPKP